MLPLREGQTVLPPRRNHEREPRLPPRVEAVVRPGGVVLTRRLFLPLRPHEIQFIRDGDAVVAPFHREHNFPCGGCEEHRRDVVAVVVAGQTTSRLTRRMRDLGERLKFNSLNASLEEEELRMLADRDVEEARAVVLTYKTGYGDVELLLTPPASHDVYAESLGWGDRTTVEELGREAGR